MPNFNKYMRRIIVWLVVLLFILALGITVWIYKASKQQPTNNPTSTTTTTATSTSTSAEPVSVASPLAGAVIASPLTVIGQAHGQWYFEASFPVRVVDANGKTLGSAPAQAQSDWMTESFVPFRAVVEFSQPSTSSGFIILAKDNPSGLPQNDAQVQIPIKFDISQVTTTAQRTVKFYYYDANRDKDAQGKIACSRNGLVPVDRQIPVSISPIKDTISSFLSSPLPQSAKDAGLTSEFPLPGVALDSVVLNSGVLTIKLSDPQHKTSGGSCRAAILWAQIKATALQFPEVKSVRFEPADLFQP